MRCKQVLADSARHIFSKKAPQDMGVFKDIT